MGKSEREARSLQRRRLRAGRLLEGRVAPAEVARRVGVTRTTVSQWNSQLEAGGLEALNSRPRGRSSGLGHTAARVDAGPDGRTTRRGLCYGAVDAAARGRADQAALYALVRREPSVAHPHLAELLLPATLRASAPARRGCDQVPEADALAGSEKSAAKQCRIIVFIDGSGLSDRPTRVRTWAPKGETPLLQRHFNWHALSVIAGIACRRFYFRLLPRDHQGPADCRVPACSPAAGPTVAAGHVGRAACVPVGARARPSGSIEWCHPDRTAAGLRARAQPDRIHRRPSQTPRARQPLRRGLPRPEDRPSQPPPLHAAVSNPDRSVLAPGRAAVLACQVLMQV